MKASGNGINLFFTKKLFSQSIKRAKNIAILDLRRILIKTGILQTRDFILPEMYVEIVDTIARMVWFCLYRDTAIEAGLTDMTTGKLIGLTDNLVLPTRLIDLFVSVLSPVLIGKEVFLPDISLVKCNYFEKLTNASFVFGTSVGAPLPLALRYGIPFRLSIFDRIGEFPGAMSSLREFEYIHVNNRVIVFKPLSQADKELISDQSKPYLASQKGGADIVSHSDEVNCAVEDYSIPAMDNRLKQLSDQLYEVHHCSNYDELEWFVPYTYHRLVDYNDLGKLFGSYLHLVWHTEANIDSRRISVLDGLNDVEVHESFIPLRGNYLSTPNSINSLISLKHLRFNEGRIRLPYQNDDEVEGNILNVFDLNFYNREFPSLDDPLLFLQHDWNIPAESPFFPTQFKATRWIRTALKSTIGRTNVDQVNVQGNVHQATKEGKLSRSSKK